MTNLKSQKNSFSWKKSLFPFHSDFFGIRPITLVAITIALAQGMNQIADLSINYLYKDNYGFGPVQVSFVLCATSIPWLIKPLWGVISDNITFFGYRRKSYLMLWSFLQFFYYYSLATWVRDKWLGVLFLTLIQVSIAFNNVIGEALLVESAQNIPSEEVVTEEQKQAEATKNVSLFFGVRYFGVLTTAYLGGLLLNYVDKYTIFFFAGTLPFLVFCVGAFIMKETKRTPPPRGSITKYHDIPDYTQLAHSNENLIFGVENDGRVDFLEDEELNQISKNFSQNDEAGNWRRVIEFVKKPVILRPIVFLLLFMITPSCSSIMFYFYTNELKFSPDFMGQLRFASSFASILGVYTFNRYLKNVSFEKILYWSTIICVVLGSTQILLVLRWNRNLGIPDKLFSIGDSIIINTFGEINYLPILVVRLQNLPQKR